MPIYYLSEFQTNRKIVVEAKSETEARLHVTKGWQAELVGAKRLAELVRAGVAVEKAGAEAEAAQTEERR